MSSYSATLRIAWPTNKQIHHLNENAIVSLSNDYYMRKNWNTHYPQHKHYFLALNNTRVDIINNHDLDILFQPYISLMMGTNGLQSQMPVYHYMTVIIMENSYVILFAAIISNSLNISYFCPNVYWFTCRRDRKCNMIGTVHG